MKNFYFSGVFHVKKYPSHIIDISDVVELKIFLLDINLVLGAGMTLSDMMEIFLKMSSENENFSYLKEFYAHMDLVAHIPVKNVSALKIIRTKLFIRVCIIIALI